MQARRHATKRIPRKQGVEIRVSLLALLPDDPENRREYVEIREYNVDGEIYGHGILIPRTRAAKVAVMITEALA